MGLFNIFGKKEEDEAAKNARRYHFRQKEKGYTIAGSNFHYILGLREDLKKEDYHNSEWEHYSDDEIIELKNYINSLSNIPYTQTRYKEILNNNVPHLKLNYIGILIKWEKRGEYHIWRDAGTHKIFAIEVDSGDGNKDVLFDSQKINSFIAKFGEEKPSVFSSL